MKTSELMIGDLLYLNRRPVRVDAIGFNGSISYSEKGGFGGIGVDKLSPIPITEEILVKNGFHTYGESYFIPEDKCNTHVRIGFHYRETVVDLHRHGAFSIQISYKPGMLYVHTLQHLLRERGIDKEIEL